MLTRFQLLQDIGLFQSTSSPAASPLLQYALIYAENGRGKTTLSAIFHSLASGNPISINERSRLGSPDTPFIVLASSAGPPPFIFQDGAWNQPLSDLIIFDDHFVNENVYSGLVVEASHRQKLHELVIGSDGVALNRQLQNYVDRIEAHTTELRNRQNAIPARDLGGYGIDAFCDLPVERDVETRIRDAERYLAAALDQNRIRTTPAFTAIDFPDFDTEPIAEALRQTLDTLDAAAATHVQDHLQSLGRGGRNMGSGWNESHSSRRNGRRLSLLRPRSWWFAYHQPVPRVLRRGIYVAEEKNLRSSGPAGRTAFDRTSGAPRARR